ncbi:MAG: hypothetical protein K2X39_02685, partial [Silvanigrellaceae bacterium]|nr:hypothetical protein [Silvanigrellaceae bacterium]
MFFQRRQKPSLQNNHQNEKSPDLRSSYSGYVLSVFLLIISYLAVIIPLALYHAAQIASTVGKKKCFYLLLVVSCLLAFLALLFQSISLFYSFLICILSIPFFLFLIFEREHRKSWHIAALVYALPFAFLISLFLALPQRSVEDIEYSFSELSTIFQQSLRSAKDISSSSSQDIEKSIAYFEENISMVKKS